MSSRRRAFPLVPDDEPVIGQSTSMHLYENGDLITNINGTYYDKDYSDVTPEIAFVRRSKSDVQATTPPLETTTGRRYAEKAREKAKDDLRQKRQAYVNHELQRGQQSFKTSKQGGSNLPIKSATTVSVKTSEMKTKRFDGSKSVRTEKSKPLDRPTELACFSQKLHQDTYILVDLPKVYHKPEPANSNKSKKNTFDFLKRSQIYNYKERQEKRERQIAQELNLTRFDD